MPKLTKQKQSNPSSNAVVRGINDLIGFHEGDKSRCIDELVEYTELVIDVKSIREAMGLSQENFARKYGFPVSTIQNWEQKRRFPHDAARLLLKLIAKYPQLVEAELLHSTKK